MRFWTKSVRIFKSLCENANQSIRQLARQTGIAKSRVHRLKRAIERGQKFGSWTVIGPFKIGNRRRTYWKCHCDCALQIEKFIRLDVLKVGWSTSCGKCPNLSVSEPIGSPSRM